MRPLYRIRALTYLFVTMGAMPSLLSSCDDADEEQTELACVYDETAHHSSSSGSSRNEYFDQCVTVESEQECQDWTSNDLDCFDGYCIELRYANVRPGSCEAYSPTYD